MENHEKPLQESSSRTRRKNVEENVNKHTPIRIFAEKTAVQTAVWTSNALELETLSRSREQSSASIQSLGPVLHNMTFISKDIWR